LKAKKIKLKALPGKMPDFITVNIDDLDIGKSVKIGELNLPELTILDSPNNPIVSVKTTRAAVSAAAEAAEAKKK
jgi:large subunit ribosomal protein L25